MNNTYLNLKVTFTQRITIFILCFFLCLIVASLINIALTYFGGELNDKLIRISIILQNIIVFIAPAIITSIFICNNPLKFLTITKVPNVNYILLIFLVTVISTPAMNWLVEWNKNISLPESMIVLEKWIREMEASAEVVTNMLINNGSILGVIVTVLIVGVLTGFSEELFFRGMLQNIFASRPMNMHLAIWLGAFIFSLLHFQFFGFFPRLLLGAFFGYLLWWSGSIWIPIIAHILNNSTVIIVSHLSKSCVEAKSIEFIGTQSDGIPFFTIGSAIITLALLIYVNFCAKRKNILRSNNQN